MAFPLGLVAVVLFVLVAIFLYSRRPPKVGLNGTYQKYKLILKESISHNTFLFRFALQSPTTRLGLPVGQHIYCRTEIDGLQISRQYTPVSSDDDLGHFDLVVKIYPAGKLSQHLNKLKVGDYLDCRGPAGTLTYKGNGQFEVRKGGQTHVQPIKNVGLIGGGTGITPLYQVVKAVCKNPTDTTNVSLIFGNITEEDILLRDKLDALAETHSNFKVYYTLDKPSDNWRGGRGFVTADMIMDNIPPPADDTMILLCGPPPMITHLEKVLKQLNYTDKMIHRF
eukprot:TRINITY_DN542_c0_g1_i1.p1 TRINITY_DN542_c0_g1~~TRINITY_DN542_c0_g1_i1.p1  ORF type:complete len:281 (+),score=88.87 TRINITY_DN542_c0_g1_i1:58-900(+)